MPALVLPMLAGLAGIVGPPLGGDDSNGVIGLVAIVFLFVALGSMTLNTWLLLRHPKTIASHAFDRGTNIALVVLWSSLVGFGFAISTQSHEIVVGLFALLIITFSIITCVQAGARTLVPGPRIPRVEVTLGQSARVLLWLFVIAGVIALLAAIYFVSTGDEYSSVGEIVGGPATMALLLLGLPWSHPLYFLTVVGRFLSSSGQFSIAPASTTVVCAIAVCANIALALVLLYSPTGRTRITNWFFRLNPKSEVHPID